MWNSADVDGGLNSCAAGDGVMRCSTDCQEPPSRFLGGDLDFYQGGYLSPGSGVDILLGGGCNKV